MANTKSTRLHVRLTPEEKAGAEAVFRRNGLSMSRAVSLFIEQSIRVGGLPFQYSELPKEPSDKR